MMTCGPIAAPIRHVISCQRSALWEGFTVASTRQRYFDVAHAARLSRNRYATILQMKLTVFTICRADRWPVSRLASDRLTFWSEFNTGAVLLQGNRAMQRIFLTPNDDCYLLHV